MVICTHPVSELASQKRPEEPQPLKEAMKEPLKEPPPQPLKQPPTAASRQPEPAPENGPLLNWLFVDMNSYFASVEQDAPVSYTHLSSGSGSR